MTERRRLGALLFDKFELLDIFGPLEMFGVLPQQFELVTVGERQGPVASAQGPKALIDLAFERCPKLDVLLVPGGIGTRKEVDNPAVIGFLQAQHGTTEILASICTGAGLLARAGILDGRRATTNKRAWKWVIEQGPRVSWVPEARWVEDGKLFTAGGVAAGIDMSLAVIAKLNGVEIANRVAEGTEYDWHRDAAWDPFAKAAGLV